MKTFPFNTVQSAASYSPVLFQDFQADNHDSSDHQEHCDHRNPLYQSIITIHTWLHYREAKIFPEELEEDRIPGDYSIYACFRNYSEVVPCSALIKCPHCNFYHHHPDQLMYYPPVGAVPEDLSDPDTPLKKILLWNGVTLQHQHHHKQHTLNTQRGEI